MSDLTYKDLFSGHAKDYAAFRPAYPDEFIQHISHLVSYRGVVWDCGCGSGQLALPLAEYFNLVMATDISAGQIAHAPGHKGIMYTVQPAEKTDFPNEYFDMIVVGQALHWFNHEAFFREANRVLVPEGIIVAVGYGLATIDPAVDKVLRHFYTDITGPYWPEERKHIDLAYASIPWPFQPINIPAFDIKLNWTVEQLLGYLNTWSAVKSYEERNGVNPLSLVDREIVNAWGNAATKPVRFPLFVKAGRKQKSFEV